VRQSKNPLHSIFEEQAWQAGFRHVAGIDEVGVGPLAGPVVAAACVLPSGCKIQGINDSKKLTAAARKKLHALLTQDPEIDFAIAIVDAYLIDQLNILQATLEAMAAAVLRLKKCPDYLLVDGTRVPPAIPIPGKAIVEGDAQCLSIAAASIIAKESRDQLMIEYHKMWPEYGFDQHKGYSTKQHLIALKKYGPCPIHRKSFQPCKSA